MFEDLSLQRPDINHGLGTGLVPSGIGGRDAFFVSRNVFTKR